MTRRPGVGWASPTVPTPKASCRARPGGRASPYGRWATGDGGVRVVDRLDIAALRQVDVADEDAVNNLFDTAFKVHGGVDIAFNNAGISPPDDDLIENTEVERIIVDDGRAVGVVGDRWTLVIMRDCFLRVRRFEDFQARLGITHRKDAAFPAVLTTDDQALGDLAQRDPVLLAQGIRRRALDAQGKRRRRVLVEWFR